MKPLLTITMVIACMTSHAQITLEHTYPSAGYYYNGGFSSGSGSLYLWDFEQAGTKYVKVDRAAKVISLFDLDHGPFFDFSFASAPITIGTPVIMYLSQHLFDLDDGFEYMYISSAGGWSATYTRIYDQDGTVLLNIDSCSILVQSTIPPQEYPIWNTTEGTKLIVSCGPEQSARVYGLPGTLSSAVATAASELVASTPPSALIFPNPSDQRVTIEYAGILEEDIEDLLLTDESGRLCRTIHLGMNAGRIDVVTSDLAPGSYDVQLRTRRGIFPGGRFVVAR